ncbi:hypothetical protein [Acidiphilium sp.]|uniref:hypothetical protein n=1 Tax=Acidiphilium sp. TaxID=527 RepID=UPI003CFF683B
MPSILFGLSSNPIWVESGAVVGVGSPILAGSPFDDPNVGWTNQALGHLAAQDWLHGRIPWWNPYSGIGLPLAGEMQPAAMFLPFVLLLGFQGGIVWLELSLQVFAGIATFLLLRRLDLGRVSALAGALLFEFNGTFASVPGETILNVMPFLPLLLLGIEYARAPGEARRAIIVVALAIGGSLLAGFPEAAYIDGLMALLWTVFRVFGTSNRLRFLLRIGVGGVIGLMLAAPLLVAFVDFSALTNVFQNHTIGGVALDLRGLGPVVMPYVYGPLGTSLGSNLLLTISGGTGGYIGAVFLLFAIIGALIERDRPIVVMLVLWLVLCAGKTFGFPPIMSAMNLLPFMKDTEFFRYSSPSWELAVIILIARALDSPNRQSHRYLIALAGTAVILAFAIDLAWPWARAWHWSDANRMIMTKWLLRAAGFQFIALLAASIAWLTSDAGARRWRVGGILVLYSMVLLAVPQFSGVKPGKIDHAAINYLKVHTGLDRFYSLGPIQPNYSAYFAIPNINHNYLPVALNWTDFVEKSLFPSVASQDGGIFWAPFPPMQITTAVNDLQQHVASYQFLGVHYVIASPGVQLTSTVSMPDQEATRVPFQLNRGQSLTLDRVAPAIMSRLGPISEIGIFQGNYANTATGRLAVKLCANHQCSSGTADLAHSADNSAFRVNLAPPITIRPGERFSVTVSHASGSHPDAIWLWSHPDAGQTLVTGTGQVLTGRTIQLVFDTGANTRDFQHVYSDHLMNIWRLHGADPFYTTAGSACSLHDARLNRVVALCDGPATLTRRELFMPGWHATINHQPVPIRVDHQIAQRIRLHAGRNGIVFHFAPPFVGFAWIGFWIGVAALLLIGGLPRAICD